MKAHYIKKTSHVATLLAAVGGGILLFYLILKVFSLGTYTESSKISFTDKSFTNRSGNFYIYEDSDPLKFDPNITSEEAPKILTTPLTVVWKPENYPIDKEIEISAEINSTYDLNFKVNCKPCTRDIDTPTNSFFLKKLYDYPYVAEFKDGYIYSLEPLPKPSGTLKDWLSSHLNNGQDVEILNSSLPLESIESDDIGYKKDSYSSIQTDLLGTHEFYVYLENELQLQLKFRNRDFTKIDPNLIKVSLLTLDGDELPLEITSASVLQTIPTDSLTHTYELKEVPKKGTYKLLVSIPEETIIKALDINSNKIVLNNHVNLLREAELYTQTENTREFFIKPTSYSGISDVSIVNLGESEQTSVINQNRNNLVVEREIAIDKGQYRLETGGALQLDGMLFSFSSEQFYNPFKYELSLGFTSDYVITNFLQRKLSDGDSQVTFALNNSDLLPLKSLQRIEFQISSDDLLTRFNTEKAIEERYFLSDLIPPYQIYSVRNAENIYGAKIGSIETVSDLLDILPEKSTILFTTKIPFPQDLFISEAGGNSFSPEPTELELNLLGDHQFYLIAPERLSVDITLDPYVSDQLFQLQLRNSNGQVTCTKNYTINSSDSARLLFECDTREGEIYTLNVRSQRQESSNIKGSFEIVKMSVNTNKVMIKQRARTLNETRLYSTSPVEQRLEISPVANASSLETLISDDHTVTVNTALDSEGKELIIKNMPKGGKEFVINQKGVVLRGMNFALNRENLFDPYSHYIVLDINSRPDYIISDLTEDNGLYIKTLNLNVK